MSMKIYIKKSYKKILIDMSKSFTKTKKNGKDSRKFFIREVKYKETLNIMLKHQTCHFNKLHQIKRLTEQELDEFSSDFLKRFYSKDLNENLIIDVDEIATKNGIKIMLVPLGDKLYGKTYFEDDSIVLFDGKHRITKKIQAGTILINNTCNKYRYKQTVIHEMVHLLYHGKYITLLKSLKEKNHNYKQIQNKILNELEWQAEELSLRIFMPKEQVLNKIQEISNNKKIMFVNQTTKLYYLVNELAYIFDCSIEQVKKRLLDLNFTLAMGIENYLDGVKLLDFCFSNSNIKKNQTFIISNKELTKQLKLNSGLSNLYVNNKIKFINNMLVINHHKYIDNQGRLTKYALDHVDECSLLFDVKEEPKYQVDTLVYLTSQKESKTIVTLNDEQMEYIEKQIEEMINDAIEYGENQQNIPQSFSETLKYFYELSNFKNYSELSFESDVSERSISKYISGEEKNPKRIKVLKLGLALRMLGIEIEDMMKKADISFTGYGDKGMIVLKTVVFSYSKYGLPFIYVILKKHNYDYVLEMSPNYLKNHFYD